MGIFLALAGCSGNTAKSHYLLAERLWNDARYEAAVTEFEKVVSRDTKGKLGLQALYRAALTEELYLNQYDNAVKKFRQFTENSQDTREIWEARKQIGEILFSKTEQYEQAIQYYRDLIRMKPDAPEVPEFLFRIAKSQFYRWQFNEAVAAYRELTKTYPKTQWGERAAFEIGVTQFTRGEQHPSGNGPGMGAYRDAIAAYKNFVNRYPTSNLVPQAQFGIGSCFEELDLLDAAISQYQSILNTYPSPNVIKIKLARIKDRRAQRNR